MTLNDEFFNALVRRQIRLMQLADGVAARVDRILAATQGDIRARLQNVSDARLDKVLRAIKLLRSDAWKGAREEWFETARELARAEPRFLDRQLNTLSPVILETTLPSITALAQIVSSNPIQGRTLTQWAKGIEQADIQRISDAIRIGLVQGETGPQIAQRVVGTVRLKGKDGVLEVGAQHARSIARTMVNSVANQAKREYYKENAGLFSSEVFLATLDARTTLICASNDNKQFPVGEGPIPPLHWNCRSLRMAVVNGEVLGERPARNFTEQQLLREFSGQRNIKSRDDLPFGSKLEYDKFARKRKRELTGRVPARMSYPEWLRTQKREVQEDILGAKRAKLFRSGQIKLDRFVNSTGRVLTLEELEALE